MKAGQILTLLQVRHLTLNQRQIPGAERELPVASAPPDYCAL